MIKLVLGLILLPSAVMAEELEAIVFTSKQEVSQSKMTSSVAVIDNDQIDSKVHLRATDLLSSIPGLQIEQQGIVGGISNVYIRGAESKHTVIMIDGVKVFDPTSIGGKLDLSILNSLDIEKIEVMKGPQSVLHGSDAIGGVINFITKKGSNKQSISIGTGIAQQLSTNNSIVTENGLVNITAFYQEANVDSDVANTDEKDFKLNRGVTATGTFDYGKLELQTTLKLTNDFAQVDSADSNGYPIDSEIAYQKQNHLFFKEGITLNLNRSEKMYLDLAISRFERSNKSSYGLTKYDGTTLEAEYRYLKKQNNGGQYLLGATRTSETYRDNTTEKIEVSLDEFFVNKMIVNSNHTFEVGSRLAHSEDFGDHGLYALGWKVNTSENSAYRLGHKTAYKAPTVYELYGPATDYGPVGNSQLSPEKSHSFDASYDYINNGLSVGSSIFYTEVSEFINYDEGYENIDGFITRGVELYFNKIDRRSRYGANFSKFDYSLSTGKKAEKKPYETAAIFYDFILNDFHSFGVHTSFNAKRYEYVKKDTILVELDAYEVVDFNYTYTNANLKFLTAVKNVFDRKYETSSDYSVQGLGVQFNLKYFY